MERRRSECQGVCNSMLELSEVSYVNRGIGSKQRFFKLQLLATSTSASGQYNTMQVESGDTDELAEAMQTEQRWTTAASAPPQDGRSAAGHPAPYPDQRRSIHRRNSFDERRIPPTLLEDASVQHTLTTASSPMTAHRSGARPRSGTISSHKLLRRISSDTVQSMDFDSDVSAPRTNTLPRRIPR